MSKDFELSDSQTAILSELRTQSRRREEAMDFISVEGSNDALHGFFNEADKTSDIRGEARGAHIPEKEIAKAILSGISKKERQYLWLFNNNVLTREEKNELATNFGIEID